MLPDIMHNIRSFWLILIFRHDLTLYLYDKYINFTLLLTVGQQAPAYPEEITSYFCLSSSGMCSLIVHLLVRLVSANKYFNFVQCQQKDGEYLSGHEVFLRRVASAFNNFAESTERSCRDKSAFILDINLFILFNHP